MHSADSLSRKGAFFSLFTLKRRAALWLAFHVLIIAVFVIALVARGGFKIDADLFNMFPKTFSDDVAVRLADEKLTEITAQNIIVMAECTDFQKAKKAAVGVYEKVKDSDNFKSLQLYSSAGDFTTLAASLQQNHFNMLNEEAVNSIEKNPALFAEKAVAQAFSPFSILGANDIESDPFMLCETEARGLLNALKNSGVSISLKDGVMAAKDGDLWYVLINGILSKKGAALVSKTNGVAELYNAAAEFSGDDVNFIFSGAPFNSHESSNSAIKEVSIISGVSIALVLVILISVFKSAMPLLLSLLSILLSVMAAFCSTIAVFGKIHILALVFGTSLIGSCIDYSLHFFTRWMADKRLANGEEAVQKIFSGLALAILSSVVCYAALLFAPFQLLKQMAVFSIVGLSSSFLTTVCVFPFIPLPPKEKQISLLKLMKPSGNKENKRFVGRVGVFLIFAFSLSSLLILHDRFSVRNDLTKLYTMEGKLLEDRVKTNSITKYAPSGWFVVRGDSEDALLEKEEELCRKIDELTSGRTSYMATSKFIPSIAHQNRSREAVKKLLPLAAAQYEALGFSEEEAASLSSQLEEDFRTSEGSYISLAKGTVPSVLTGSLSSFWLGEIGGKWYSVVMPNMILDSVAFRTLAKGDEDLSFANKVSDMSADLDRLTLMILKFFAAAYVVMFVVLKLFYKMKQTLKIISVPILIVLTTAAIFAWLKIDLEFFSVTGMILVFGLGLDYIIYMMENEKPSVRGSKTIEPFATLLSFVSTIVSFGALSLSSFRPVHLIGLSIFIGLSTAYVSTMFYDRSL